MHSRWRGWKRVALRAAGITQPIVLLEGVFAPEHLLEAARHGFDLVVHDPLQIELLEEYTGPRVSWSGSRSTPA